MKNLLIFSIATILSFVGCVSIQPVGDTTAPEIMIQLRNSDSGAILLASSDADTPTPSLGCPIGTFSQGQNTNSYFTDLPRNVSLIVTSIDQGGVRALSIVLSGKVVLQDVTGVEAVNDPEADIDITQINPAEVKIDVDFSNLRTAQILAFRVAADEKGLIIRAETSDFANLSTALPEGQTGGTDHGGQIFDIAHCQ